MQSLSLSWQEAALLSGLGVKTLMRLAHEGTLKTVKTEAGKRVRPLLLSLLTDVLGFPAEHAVKSTLAHLLGPGGSASPSPAESSDPGSSVHRNRQGSREASWQRTYEDQQTEAGLCRQIYTRGATSRGHRLDEKAHLVEREMEHFRREVQQA